MRAARAVTRSPLVGSAILVAPVLLSSLIGSSPPTISLVVLGHTLSIPNAQRQDFFRRHRRLGVDGC
jgi:hypothetical protein